MPHCSACGKVTCGACRLVVEASGCAHKNYEAATIKMVGGLERRASVVAAIQMATVSVVVGGKSTAHAYRCPPGTYPPTTADVHDIWNATEGKAYGMKAGTNGSGGGRANPSNSRVFSLRAGTSGRTSYGGNDHFHVSVPGYVLGSTTRVWYCVDTTSQPAKVIFSAMLDG